MNKRNIIFTSIIFASLALTTITGEAALSEHLSALGHSMGFHSAALGETIHPSMVDQELVNRLHNFEPEAKRCGPLHSC